MCLILLAHRAHAAYPLVVAANRDEWFHRPTLAAGFWPDAPEVFAGRDLQQQGTWLGVTRRGRFAALTNFRDPGSQRADAPSRGELVSAFLRADLAPFEYLTTLRAEAARYNGFSLLVGNGASLCYFSNREGEIRTLAPGIHGLSNSLLDEPWPKVQIGKQRLAAQLEREMNATALLAILDDTGLAPDAALPRTGVDLDLERRLSALRIVGSGYGTRSSTVVAIGADGTASFVERTFSEDGAATGLVSERFRLEA